MTRSMNGLVVCFLIAATGCATWHGSERAVIRAKDKVAPALVHIRPVKEVFTGGKREEILVVGSGFIISADGYVVTNEHVAGESNLVRCVLASNEEVNAEVVGADKMTDIAVLKIVTDRKDLPAVKLGSSAAIEVGETVLALGSPHGLSRSVSKGIVSVTDRYLPNRGSMLAPYNTWIQTDAAINQGNSGGPLVNLKGEVVGVNSRMLSGAENVGFAIPIDIAKEVVEAIIKDGRVRRSWVGVDLQEITSKTDDPSRKGVVIGDIDPMSPAYEAQIRPGDILVAVNGAPSNARFVEDLPAVRKLIADLPVGEPATFRVSRAGQERDFTVVPVEESDVRGQQVEYPEWGFTAADLTPALVRRARLPSKQGVLVSGIQVGGLAADAGIRQGDIILTVDQEPVADLAAFRRLYDERVDSGKPFVLLDAKRGAVTQYVLLKQTPGDAPSEEETNEE